MRLNIVNSARLPNKHGRRAELTVYKDEKERKREKTTIISFINEINLLFLQKL